MPFAGRMEKNKKDCALQRRGVGRVINGGMANESVRILISFKSASE